MLEFKFSRTREVLVVGADEIEEDDGGEWAAPIETVADASLSSLRAALSNAGEFWGTQPSSDLRDLSPSVGSLYLSTASAADFDVDYSERHNVSLTVLLDGRSALDIEVPIYGIDLDEDEFAPVLSPFLERSNAFLVESAIHASGNQGLCYSRVAYGPRGATVRDALQVGENVSALISQLRGGELTAEAALALLRAGRGDLLIGLPESNWLEVKSQGYDLSSGDAAKIELAQDVARFANGETDSLLVIGYRTDKAKGEEVISKLTPSVAKFPAARYHQTIDARVHPSVLGLHVQQFEVPLRNGGKGYLLATFVPAQPEESKPFLVHGAIAGSKVEGAFISIVQRRGEHSIPVTAPAIHAALAAGRALLRRGEVPTSTTGPTARTTSSDRSQVVSRRSIERQARRLRRGH